MIEKIKKLKKENITNDVDFFDTGWNSAINTVLCTLAKDDRFVVSGSHVQDTQDASFLPQAGTHLAAKIFAEKLNRIDKGLLVHNKIRRMIRFLRFNPNASYERRLRHYSGIEVLLNILGWFPDSQLPYKTKIVTKSFLGIKWEKTISESYFQMMDRQIKDYQEIYK